MKYAWISLLISFGAGVVMAQSWTAQTPLKATLISFSGGCAEFRVADGKRFWVKRESLQGFKLIPGKSEIRFYEESLPPHLCSANNH
jgi:hypothetical protein